MKRRNFVFCIGLAAAIAVTARLAESRIGQNSLHTYHHENVLGTSLELKVSAAMEEDADRAEAAVLAEIDRLSKILSAWDPSSEFSRWARTNGEAVPVSGELLEVLALYDRFHTSTRGAINASAETANALWRQTAKANREPSRQELEAAAARMLARHWTLDSEARTATRLDDAPLVLASFTKIWIAEKSAAAAFVDGVDGVVLNIGGDIVVRGRIAETVAIRDPKGDAENDAGLGQFRVRDGAIATSGSYRRGVDIASRHYSHIVDPRNGATADDVLSATVQASDAATAGALATAFSVLSARETQQVAAGYPGIQYMVIRRDGTRLASNAWRGLAFAQAPTAAQVAAAGDWNPAFELVVNLDLARVDNPRYRRPYVAVWIEDKDKFPVRTIALWYEKSRWLPELKAWYRDDRMRTMAEGSEIAGSVSSATRPPGKYTLRWDGKDNKAKPVKAGKYTVCIEAAREHGSYQIFRQEMEFNGAPKQIPLTGTTEIESANLDYRKIAR